MIGDDGEVNIQDLRRLLVLAVDLVLPAVAIDHRRLRIHVPILAESLMLKPPSEIIGADLVQSVRTPYRLQMLHQCDDLIRLSIQY